MFEITDGQPILVRPVTILSGSADLCPKGGLLAEQPRVLDNRVPCIGFHFALSGHWV